MCHYTAVYVRDLTIVPYPRTDYTSMPSVGGIACTIILAIVPTFANVRRFRYMGIISNGSAALADVIITIALVWHLVRSAKVARPENVYPNNSLCPILIVEAQDRDSGHG